MDGLLYTVALSSTSMAVQSSVVGAIYRAKPCQQINTKMRKTLYVGDRSILPCFIEIV